MQSDHDKALKFFDLDYLNIIALRLDSEFMDANYDNAIIYAKLMQDFGGNPKKCAALLAHAYRLKSAQLAVEGQKDLAAKFNNFALDVDSEEDSEFKDFLCENYPLIYRPGDLSIDEIIEIMSKEGDDKQVERQKNLKKLFKSNSA